MSCHVHPSLVQLLMRPSHITRRSARGGSRASEQSDLHRKKRKRFSSLTGKSRAPMMLTKPEAGPLARASRPISWPRIVLPGFARQLLTACGRSHRYPDAANQPASSSIGTEVAGGRRNNGELRHFPTNAADSSRGSRRSSVDWSHPLSACCEVTDESKHSSSTRGKVCS
jgi:hypothetical protein